jgi:hypothetical protein
MATIRVRQGWWTKSEASLHYSMVRRSTIDRLAVLLGYIVLLAPGFARRLPVATLDANTTVLCNQLAGGAWPTATQFAVYKENSVLTKILSTRWRRVVLCSILGALMAASGLAGVAAQAHALVTPQQSRVVAQTQVQSQWRREAQPQLLGPVSYSVLTYCLGTTILGVSNTTAQWTVNGHAINSCPVAMKAATLSWPSTENCPLGSGNVIGGGISFAPPNWLSGYGADWSTGAEALCYDCSSDGIMVSVPAYSVTVSASLRGTGT